MSNVFKKQLLTAIHRKEKFEQARNTSLKLLDSKIKLDTTKSIIQKEIKKLKRNIANSERIIHGMGEEIEKLKKLQKLLSNDEITI